jgi:hypothetical protein
LDDPADLLKEVGPDQFRTISLLRTEWLVEGWSSFFTEHLIPPLPSPSNQPRHIKKTVCCYPSQLAKVRKVRGVLEEDKILRVGDSEVFRIAMDYVTLDKITLQRLHLEDQKADGRHARR